MSTPRSIIARVWHSLTHNWITATAAKEEGSFVDTAIGKEQAKKLQEKIKESEQITQQLTGKLAEGVGKLAAK